MRTPHSAADPADSTELTLHAWRLLLAASAAARPPAAAGVASPPVDAGGEDAGWLTRQVEAYAGAPAPVHALLDLYAPVCVARPKRWLTIAQLGQSLDGNIATGSGDSYYVTGPANVRHLHRLRALCAAVVVGAGTVARDDPRLTVRHVEGPSPVRVVLDPRGQLPAQRRVFADSSAPTIVVHAAGLRAPAPGAAEVLHVPIEDGRLRLDVLLDELHARGLWSVLVEGGGATVSSFLEAGLLDRLHVAIAPLVTGQGRPGLTLPARDKIADCLRPAHRVFTMGGDVLFDCDLRAPARPADAGSDLQRVL